MRNLDFSLTKENQLINVRWAREFFGKIFKGKEAKKYRIWNKSSFPFSPIEDMFAGSSVQAIFHFHIPKCEMLQNIILKTQTAIYPNNEIERILHNNAIKALLKTIGIQSQPIEFQGKMISLYGLKENFHFIARFVKWGSQQWPFAFERAMVHWEAHACSGEADVIIELDFIIDLKRIETAAWMPNGSLRIPMEELQFEINLEKVLNEEEYPTLTPIHNMEEVMEISSEEKI